MRRCRSTNKIADFRSESVCFPKASTGSHVCARALGRPGRQTPPKDKEEKKHTGLASNRNKQKGTGRLSHRMQRERCIITPTKGKLDEKTWMANLVSSRMFFPSGDCSRPLYRLSLARTSSVCRYVRSKRGRSLLYSHHRYCCVGATNAPLW